MKKILLPLYMAMLCHSASSQTVLEGVYLNPLGDDGEPFRWIRFGEPNQYWAGFMWNNTHTAFGNGNDFTIHTYDSRDIVLAPGYGNVILNPRNTTGKIGVGTTNPAYKLDVNGSIHSKEVKVDGKGWADFVFKDGYQLKNLESVEKFIQKNGHLEHIPSEKEVQQQGIELGEINVKLLQKIEELTLYIIAQNKKIKSVAKLERRIEKLEKLIHEK